MSILYVRDKDGQFTQIPIFAGQDSGGNVDLSGYLQKTELDEAVNDALAQAKASGAFDGEPGQPGAPGYTPVKGTDYYTEADKTEMVNAVLSALPTWTGGAF